MIVINPVAVASMLVYVIAASVVLYFIYLFVLRDLTVRARASAGLLYLLVSPPSSGQPSNETDLL